MIQHVKFITNICRKINLGKKYYYEFAGTMIGSALIHRTQEQKLWYTNNNSVKLQAIENVKNYWDRNSEQNREWNSVLTQKPSKISFSCWILHVVLLLHLKKATRGGKQKISYWGNEDKLNRLQISFSRGMRYMCSKFVGQINGRKSYWETKKYLRYASLETENTLSLHLSLYNSPFLP